MFDQLAPFLPGSFWMAMTRDGVDNGLGRTREENRKVKWEIGLGFDNLTVLPFGEDAHDRCAGRTGSAPTPNITHHLC
jgi:hypothetical protein